MRASESLSSAKHLQNKESPSQPTRQITGTVKAILLRAPHADHTVGGAAVGGDCGGGAGEGRRGGGGEVLCAKIDSSAFVSQDIWTSIVVCV